MTATDAQDSGTSEQDERSFGQSTEAGTEESVEPTNDSLEQVDSIEAQLGNDQDLTDAVLTTGETVSEAIARLESTLSMLLSASDTITPTEIGFAVFVAFVGALSAYLFNLFHWRTVAKREKLSGVGNALTILIDKLESTAVEYWIRECKEENKEIDRAMEISLKTKTRLVARYVDLFVSGHKDNATWKDLQKLRSFKGEIFDVVTGEEFESRSRKASKAKALKISNLCSDATALIVSLDYDS